MRGPPNRGRDDGGDRRAMTELFTERYMLLWAAVLAAALFLPVRNLIWALLVRRARSKAEIDEAESYRLRRRAGATAALLSFVFSVFFVNTVLFPG